MYKVVLCKHGEVKIVSTGRSGTPHSTNDNSQGLQQLGDTVLKHRWLGSDTRQVLNSILVCELCVRVYGVCVHRFFLVFLNINLSVEK